MMSPKYQFLAVDLVATTVVNVGMLVSIVEPIDIHRQSTPHDELIDRLQQYDRPRTVLSLAESQ